MFSAIPLFSSSALIVAAMDLYTLRVTQIQRWSQIYSARSGFISKVGGTGQQVVSFGRRRRETQGEIMSVQSVGCYIKRPGRTRPSQGTPLVMRAALAASTLSAASHSREAPDTSSIFKDSFQDKSSGGTMSALAGDYFQFGDANAIWATKVLISINYNHDTEPSFVEDDSYDDYLGIKCIIEALVEDGEDHDHVSDPVHLRNHTALSPPPLLPPELQEAPALGCTAPLTGNVLKKARKRNRRRRGFKSPSGESTAEICPVISARQHSPTLSRPHPTRAISFVFGGACLAAWWISQA